MTNNTENHYNVEHLSPVVEGLVGDSLQARFNEALREAFEAARHTVNENTPGRIPTREVQIRDNEGHERYFDVRSRSRENGNITTVYEARDREGQSVSLNFSSDELVPGVRLAISEQGHYAVVTATNSYELSSAGQLESVTEEVAIDDVLRLLGPASCGERRDLKRNRHGVKSEGFSTDLQDALPHLMALNDGDTVYIGGVGRREPYDVYVSLIDSEDDTRVSRVFFRKKGGDTDELIVSISIGEDSTPEQVTLIEQDTFKIEKNPYSGKEGIYSRESLAIDNLASKVVHHYAHAKKEEEPKPARRSMRDRLRDALTRRGDGTTETYGTSTNRPEAMIGETPNAKEVRELRATLNSVYSRPEVVTALESGSSEAKINGVTLLIGPLQEPLNLDGATLPSADRAIGISENTDPDTLLPLTGILESSDGQITSMTVAGMGDYEFIVYTPVANGPTRKDHHYRSDNGLLEERGPRLGARVRRFFKSKLGF